jgi:hypothetical protein
MYRDHEHIRILAYRLWEARGRPDGSADQDWLEAERRLSAADTAGPARVEAPNRQTLGTSKMKIGAPATPRAPATPGVRPRTSAPITDSDHASKKQEPGWPGSS